MKRQVNVGYGKNLEEYRPELPFSVKLLKLKRTPLLPFAEATAAAQEIYAELGEAPTLCLSGGLDSEAMALAFLAAKIPFDVTTLRFASDLNLNEIRHATEFCKRHGLKHNLIDLDVVAFYEKEQYLDYFDKYYCHSVEISVQLWFLEQIKKPLVWGGETFRLFLKDNSPSIQAVSEYEAVIYRFIDHNGLKAIPNFHFYSAELAWSFFSQSLNIKSTVYADDHCAEYYQEKLAYYKLCGFPFETNTERAQKLHGFEGLKIFFDQKLALAGSETYRQKYRGPDFKKYPIANAVHIDIPKDDQIAAKILGLA